ncbi:hypothetical protein [Nocardia noduli]|uniref:hypothetical protein n=1 Tax=Nocardia noduli TaxID=2815722 RepID=UPI001C22232B|nr:hypothetical protein [Nocardia noduli]
MANSWIRVVFEALANFTNHMLDCYPQFSTLGHHTEMVPCQAWDVTTRDWAVKPFRLPIAGVKPLLLVPTGWVRPNLLMSATRYYETSVLDYIQMERSHISPDGKVLKTPKDRLMKEPGIGRGRRTNRATTHRAHENNQDLLMMFKQFVDMKWTDPTNGGSRAA